MIRRSPISCLAGLVLAGCFALLALAPQSQAQTTILSDESLQSSTLLVHKGDSTATCTGATCEAHHAMFRPLTVQCPAGVEGTCTFHISLNAQVETDESNPIAAFQFLVDNAAPSPGPTDANGNYQFLANRVSSAGEPPFQSFSAAVDATVTGSGSHTIAAYIACRGTGKGCKATAHWSEMKVDILLP